MNRRDRRDRQDFVNIMLMLTAFVFMAVGIALKAPM